MGLRNLPQMLLRLGLAFTLLYAAWSSFQRPLDWVGFLPPAIAAWLPAGMSMQQFLMVFSLFEIVLALLLLLGKQLIFASLVTAVLMFGIMWFNPGAMDILFRDIGLVSAALALAVLARRGK